MRVQELPAMLGLEYHLIANEQQWPVNGIKGLSL